MLNEREQRILVGIEGDLVRDRRLVRALSMERAGARWRLACDLTIAFSLVVGTVCLVLADKGTLGSAVTAAALAGAIAIVRHRRSPYRLRRRARDGQKRPAVP